MVLTKVIVPFSACKAGGTSQTLHNFVYNWILAGYKIEKIDDDIVLKALNPVLRPTFVELMNVVTNGGIFENIKLGIKIAYSARNSEVPMGIKGRSYINDQEEEVIRTWAEWAQAGNVAYKVKDDQSDIIFKGVYGGNLLSSDELKIIYQQTYASVLEWNDFVSLYNSEDYNR